MGIRGKKETKKNLRDIYRYWKWFYNDRGWGNTKSEEQKTE